MRMPVKKYLVVLGVYWGVAVVLIVLASLFVLAPQQQQVDTFRNQLDEATTQLAQAQESQKPKSKERLARKLEEAQQKLGEFAIDADEVATLTFEIGQMANDLQLLDLTSKRKEGLSQDVLEGCRTIGEVWFELDFESDFHKFAECINRLERHRPVVFIEKFNIEKNPRKAGGREVDMTLCFFVQSKEVAQL